MKKEQDGVVIELNDTIAKVKVARHGDCENCGSCPGSNAMVLEVNNTLGAKKGELVTFEVKEKNMLKAAFIVYVLPLLAMFIGAQLGRVVSEFVKTGNYIFEVIGGSVAFLLSIVLIFYYEKASRSNIHNLPRITKIR